MPETSLATTLDVFPNDVLRGAADKFKNKTCASNCLETKVTPVTGTDSANSLQPPLLSPPVKCVT